MINILKKTLTQNFPRFLKTNEKINSSHYLMYSKRRFDAGLKKINCYDGSFQCGLMTLIALDHIKYKTNLYGIVFVSSFGYGKYLEDHAYIHIPEHDLYIDMTYKQFMRDDRNCGDNIDNPYQDYVYKELPMFHIGSLEDIMLKYEKAEKLNTEVYGSSSLDLDHIKNFWSNPYDDTDRFVNNFYRLKKNSEQLTEQLKEQLTEQLTE